MLSTVNTKVMVGARQNATASDSQQVNKKEITGVNISSALIVVIKLQGKVSVPRNVSRKHLYTNFAMARSCVSFNYIHMRSEVDR